MCAYTHTHTHRHTQTGNRQTKAETRKKKWSERTPQELRSSPTHLCFCGRVDGVCCFFWGGGGLLRLWQAGEARSPEGTREKSLGWASKAPPDLMAHIVYWGVFAPASQAAGVLGHPVNRHSTFQGLCREVHLSGWGLPLKYGHSPVTSVNSGSDQPKQGVTGSQLFSEVDRISHMRAFSFWCW